MSFNREAENKLKVYVGGLTPEISEADIRTHFAKVRREEEEKEAHTRAGYSSTSSSYFSSCSDHLDRRCFSFLFLSTIPRM